MASLRKRGTLWYYRFTDENGRKVERKGYTDRRATEQLAATVEQKVSLVAAGLVNPQDIAYQNHAARPLVDHIDDWEAGLRAQGVTDDHAQRAANRIRRLIALMLGSDLALQEHRKLSREGQRDLIRRIAAVIRPARLSDLDQERVQAALSRLKAAGKSLGTIGGYRIAIRSFSKWLWNAKRTREDLLHGVKGYNVKEDPRHERRTIALAELRRLIGVTHEGGTHHGMTGPARALCYRLAVASGLRYSEIGSITPSSFHWDARPATVTVTAAFTKNGQTATLPLPDDLAADLRAYVAPLNPGKPIFPLPADDGARMLRVDLQAAGIPYRDDSGRVFDFHALRCQLATLADAAGVSPRVVQKLMRHSSLELTGRYTKPRAVDIEAAASKLPSLKPEDDQPETLAATGTDGPIHASEPQVLIPFAHPLPTGTDGSSRSETVTCEIEGSVVYKSMSGETQENKAQDGPSRLQTVAVVRTADEADWGRGVLGQPRSHPNSRSSRISSHKTAR
jgi:integrase